MSESSCLFYNLFQMWPWMNLSYQTATYNVSAQSDSENMVINIFQTDFAWFQMFRHFSDIPDIFKICRSAMVPLHQCEAVTTDTRDIQASPPRRRPRAGPSWGRRKGFLARFGPAWENTASHCEIWPPQKFHDLAKIDLEIKFWSRNSMRGSDNYLAGGDSLGNSTEQ